MQPEHCRAPGSGGDRGRMPAIRDERAGHRAKATGRPSGSAPASSTHRALRRSTRQVRSPPSARSGRRCSTVPSSAASSPGCASAASPHDYVLDALDDRFTRADLDERLDKLQSHLRTRGHAQQTISQIRIIAARTYAVEFAADIPLSERVLWPAMSAENAGMEDARFVRFVRDDGSVTFYATYTAYSGEHISQQLLETQDFLSFTSTPLVGAAAANKGLALFPRLIGGRFAAMSRSDRESNSVAFTDNPYIWSEVGTLPTADRGLGGAAARQLRAAHRDRGRVAGAHPRRRPDADLSHRGDPARPGGSDPGHRPVAAAAAESRGRRTGRLRPQRRLLLRSASCTPVRWCCRTASTTRPSVSRPFRYRNYLQHCRNSEATMTA